MIELFRAPAISSAAFSTGQTPIFASDSFLELSYAEVSLLIIIPFSLDSFENS